MGEKAIPIVFESTTNPTQKAADAMNKILEMGRLVSVFAVDASGESRYDGLPRLDGVVVIIEERSEGNVSQGGLGGET